MAIRFRPDNDNNGGNNSNRGGGGGGRNNSAIIMAIIMFAFRYPKFAVPIIIIGAIAFFIMGPGISTPTNDNNSQDIYRMGCEISQEKYNESKVFAALSSSSSKYSLPAKVSLREYAPRPLNQGSQGSCVGWASAYAARTILEAASTGANPNTIAYSPSFLYNQIGIRGCQGAYTGEALEHMKQKGLLEFSKFPYNENSCSQQPSQAQLQEALQHRIRGYNRLTKTGRNYDVDLEAVKQNIAQGAPVIIAAKVPYSFQDMMGKKVWKPRASEKRNVNNLGGHAMCLIGYDDNKKQFEIQNSWGTEWGDRGFVFVDYDDFKIFCREAYGVFPHQKATTSSSTDFAIECGLYDVARGTTLDLKNVRDNLFETTSPIKIGTELKIEITNSLECFTYVFSKEADSGNRQGKALKIFPPSDQYSSYMGIVGTRLFPRNGKFFADDEGTRDFMAIVYSKNELNPDQIQQRIDQAGNNNFYDNVMAAVGNRAFQNLNYTNKSGKLIAFKQSATAKQDVAVVVIALDKN
ncbi:C1 family peptidase [Aureispira sp. CCB-QB1]|uniref:C1 family peptidase n=1 Tax=Aureispira sp. CCB-QB1 TaxID=1313421 RepID=UPI0006962141|nr:C1 family peptidase [Aureispira sp. CCB-QB1]